MRPFRPFVGLLLTATFVVSSCSSGGAALSSGGASEGMGVGPGAAPGGGAGSLTIATASTASLGTFLVGPTGLTLYVHAGDSTNTSTCTGACLTAWPLLTAPAGEKPVAGPGVTGRLSTFARPYDPSLVTYNGLPLYYWQGDTKPGDATGQGIEGFSVASVERATVPAASSSADGGNGYAYP